MTDLHYSPNLLLVMDCLWYHQIVLFSEPIPKPTPTSQPSSSSQTSLASLSDLSSTPLVPAEEDYSASSSSETSPKDDSSASGDDTDADDYEELHYRRKRRGRGSRLTLAAATTKNSRSTCSSPSLPKHVRNIGFDTPLIKKTMSCKTLFELEYEEVKGFMDLGFTFNKEKLCPRMMSVIPGLQRLDEYFNKEGVDEQEAGKQSGVMRPYLSEAWLIKRPDSPLLNLRIPRVTTADDMKKHLKYWARTVASAIEQGRGLN